jgi:hypothetical protein
MNSLMIMYFLQNQVSAKFETLTAPSPKLYFRRQQLIRVLVLFLCCEVQSFSLLMDETIWMLNALREEE